MSKQTKLQTKKITSTNASASTSQREILLADDLQQCQTQAPEDVEALILKVSESFGATMEEKLSKFSETLDKILTTLDDHSMRITAAEQRVSDMEDDVTGLGKRLAKAEKKIVLLVSCVDDLENRSRREASGRSKAHVRGKVVIKLHNSRDKQRIMAAGIRFNMRFPATLTLTHQGATHKFSSPKEAEAFVQALV
ncbi:hypothetical protein WMY93_031929 [Mugilogobius chulae]|uniref:Uncharacterized protein n=1 Tax=Mugilogobius chulae TaxID=88201 RepID=A0AAW0MFB4_9GOBI